MERNEKKVKCGEWLCDNYKAPSKHFYCSECGALVETAYYCYECYYKFCPNCAAKMDGEEDE